MVDLRRPIPLLDQQPRPAIGRTRAQAVASTSAPLSEIANGTYFDP
ncbi:hypothetical protein [Nocardia sp. NPDC050412]